jgi:hypothetical protein
VLDSIIRKLIPDVAGSSNQEQQRPAKKQKVENVQPKPKGESIPFKVLVDENWIKEQEFDMPTDLHEALVHLPILKVDQNTTIAKVKVILEFIVEKSGQAGQGTSICRYLLLRNSFLTRTISL